MRRFTLVLAFVTLVALTTTVSAQQRGRGSGYGQGGYHPYGGYGGNARLHDDLDHNGYHRELYHNDAHRYPMSRQQHGRLHDDLDHDVFHDELYHRETHRQNAAPARLAPSFSIGGRRVSFWFGY